MVKKKKKPDIKKQLNVSVSCLPRPPDLLLRDITSFWYVLLETSANVQAYMNTYTFLLYRR